MPAFAATAPGKIILFGEHAVVYGRPAIAVPVLQVRARAAASALIGAPPGTVTIRAGDIDLDSRLDQLPAGHPLALAVTATTELLGLARLPALRLEISSTIPIASGMGSGAAVSAAIARALSGFAGHPLTNEQVSAIAYRVDQHYHGTPSGIDNTVIAYAQPVFFVRGQPFHCLNAAQPFTIVIGNTGAPSPTGLVVGELRQRWLAAPGGYETVFDQIGDLTHQARRLIEKGPVEAIGPLMLENHRLLQTLNVSSPELDRLVQAAMGAGALGAKLCGGGRGGNMIALARDADANRVAGALQQAGAANTIVTTVRQAAE